MNGSRIGRPASSRTGSSRGRSSRLAAGLAVAVLAGCLSGCGQTDPVVTVLGPWLGGEADQFIDVLAVPGVEVRYQGTRTPGEALRSADQTRNPPDIVVLPTLGDLATYVAGRTVPPGATESVQDFLDIEPDGYDPFWLTSATSGAKVYSIPIKANLKSMVWYRKTTDAPDTWTDALSRTWCMGMGDPPNSGWPGTDWIEDLLLHQYGAPAYAQWVRGDLHWNDPRMTGIWRTWGELVRQGRPGRGLSALLTQYGDAGRGLDGGTEPCELDHQPSFIPASYAKHQPPFMPASDANPTGYDFRQYPTGPPGQQENRSVVSVDVAALLSDRPEVRKVMKHLASKEGQAVWPAEPNSGAYSVYKQQGIPDRETVPGKISATLIGETDAKFCLDASDLMPTTMREAFYAAVREYLGHLDDQPSRLGAILERLEGVRSSLRTTSQWVVDRQVCSD